MTFSPASIIFGCCFHFTRKFLCESLHIRRIWMMIWRGKIITRRWGRIAFKIHKIFFQSKCGSKICLSNHKLSVLNELNIQIFMKVNFVRCHVQSGDFQNFVNAIRSALSLLWASVSRIHFSYFVWCVMKCVLWLDIFLFSYLNLFTIIENFR